MNKYVTKTGRAISPGRVTRSSNLIRIKSNYSRPLPIHLQCHPKALTPTPTNPGCHTYNRALGMGYGMALRLSMDQIRKGKGLSRKGGRFALVNEKDKVIGYLDDPIEALAYKKAAAMCLINLEVIDNGQ